MSLATTGGAASAGLSSGGAGLSVAAMAHNTAPHAAAVAQPAPHPHHGSIPHGSSSYAAAPGTSYAALGADLLDKTQSFLSGKHVRQTATLPIAAVDLYGDKCHVAYFPPVGGCESREERERRDKAKAAGGDDDMAAAMEAVIRKQKGVRVRSVGGLWANRDDNSAVGSGRGGNVTLKRDDDASYKAVKRYLAKGAGRGAVLRRSLLPDATDARSTDEAIVLPRPHLLLGARSLEDVSSAGRAALGPLFAAAQDDDDDGAATSRVIDREFRDDEAPSPVSLAVIALDGDASPKGDDFDRVAFRIKLSSKKKALTMLPEEAVGLAASLARKRVMDAYFAEFPESDLAEECKASRGPADGDDGDDEELYGDFPPAVAIPGWATMDPSLEALVDATKGSSPGACGPSLHPRSVAACVGALLPPSSNSNSNSKSNSNPSKLTKLLLETIRTKRADAAKEAARIAAQTKTDPVEPEPFLPLLVLVGATTDGLEVTAMQLSKPQGGDEEVHCPFGGISVVSSVCCCRGAGTKEGKQRTDEDEDHDVDVVEEKLQWAMDRLRSQVGLIAPESEEPTAIVTYGTIATQLKVATKLKAILTGYGREAHNKKDNKKDNNDNSDDDDDDDDDWDGWDQDIPLLSTHESCTSVGLAVLAAASHSRVKLVVSVKGTDGKHRPKPKPAVDVKSVATCQVAVSFNYFGGDENKWTEPKTLFDFDRRVPAGPYRVEFSAAECAAHGKFARSGKASNDFREITDETVLMDVAKSLEGARGIPEREEAALGLRFRVLQRTTRDDEQNGRWIRIGDDMSPLTMEHSQKDEGESGRDHLVACESAVMEISLSPVGLITTALTTNGETIVQATKSARNSKLLKYAGILGSLLFVGGFLVKSFVEERVFERDTQRVLAYYKHAAPNSFHDGDERHARYMVWKYKGKKDALWRRLEAKYGVPVKHAWEWDDDEEGDKEAKGGEEEEEEEAEDLDGSDEGEEL